MDPTTLEAVTDRARDALSVLPEQERGDARRVLELCARLVARERVDSKLLADENDAALRVELGRLAEVLGRRHARAILFACLARAALAELAGEPGHARDALGQAERLLALQAL